MLPYTTTEGTSSSHSEWNDSSAQRHTRLLEHSEERKQTARLLKNKKLSATDSSTHGCTQPRFKRFTICTIYSWAIWWRYFWWFFENYRGFIWSVLRIFVFLQMSFVTNRVIFPRGQGLNQYYPLAVIRRLFLFSIYPDKKLDKVFGNVISLNRYFPFCFKRFTICTIYSSWG